MKRITELLLKNYLLLAFIIWIGNSHTLYAQTVGFLSKSISPSGAIGQSQRITIDAMGNVYQTGFFNKVISFGSYTLTPASVSSDIYIVKYDSLGVVQWARRAGSAGSDNPNGIAVLDGNVYVTGNFENTINFNTPSAVGSNEVISAGGKDIFIAKFDDQGNFKWAKRCGGSDVTGDFGGNLAIGQSSLYFVGSYETSINFNTPSSTSSNTLFSTSSTDRDAFIAKFDTSGNFIWARRIGGNSDESAIGIVTKDTNIFISGAANSTPVRFYLNASSSNSITVNGNTGRSTFLAKYGSSGLVQWARIATGSVGIKYSTSVSVLDTSVYICGRFADSIKFNIPSLGANDKLYCTGAYDIFLAKYNTQGTFLWAKRAGSSSIYDEEASAVVAVDSSIYMAGYFHDTANFNTPSASGSNEIYESLGGLTSSSDGFVAKYNSMGNIIWLKRLGGTAGDICNDIVITPTSFYITGGFGSIANFNTPISSGNDTLSTVATRESYLAKFSLSSIPLGVTLLDFKGLKTNKGNLLQWTTSSEQNSLNFNIEHSSDAKNFTRLGTIQSKATNGNSSINLDYEFIDQYPTVGSNYYRLEQVDIDGKKTNSNTIMLIQMADNEISIYPNPVKNQLYIYSNKKNLSYQIKNSVGQLMEQGHVPANKTISLQHYLPGVYIISVDAKAFKFVKE